MIYLRRKLLATAKAMAQGIEPKEPWIPESYHYHSASAEIRNGDIEAAIEEAKAKAKESLIPAEMRSEPEKIAAV
jgi:hypothetical protein